MSEKDLEGFKGIQKDSKGVKKDSEGLTRMIEKYLEGFKRIQKDLEGFRMIQKDLEGLARTTLNGIKHEKQFHKRKLKVQTP